MVSNKANINGKASEHRLAALGTLEEVNFDNFHNESLCTKTKTDFIQLHAPQ